MSRTPAVRKLAVRAPNWVGDLVMATPMLEALCTSERFERVDVLLRAHLAPLVADAPWSDRLRPIASSSAERALLRELQPDAVLLLSNSFGAAWRAFRAGVPLRLGSALSGRRLLLTHSIVPPTRGGRRLPVPTAHLLRDLTALAGVDTPELTPRLYLRDELRAVVREELTAAGLGAGEDYILCCPGAAFGAAKLWPPEHFAAALDELCAETGARALIGGGPGEEPLMDAVAGLCRSDAISLAAHPRDLERLKAQVAGARLLLVGDSGPRWVAAAFDVPCVSVMGPNFPELTATSLERCRVVRLEGLPCSPCLERVCPLEHHRCMRELSPARVVAAARELLAEATA
ncbi:MAG: glycosyltransferase family 9 protein [Planctomycetes bacterium]|nr:glycosyltransferase family 9 protein [Planctomycetota bacterium]MCB9905778.1 glycosyltransferase family 9 protein [Planctomycetota bacterium]